MRYKTLSYIFTADPTIGNLGYEATSGYCDSNCKNFIIFIIIFAICVFMHSTSEVGSMLLVMRCTHPKGKSNLYNFELCVCLWFSFICYRQSHGYGCYTIGHWSIWQCSLSHYLWCRRRFSLPSLEISMW